MNVKFDIRCLAAWGALACVVAGAVACTGQIDGGAPRLREDPVGPPDGPVVTPPPGDPAAAPVMPLRRLARSVYNHVVRDLLGDNSRPADAFSESIAGSSGFAAAGVAGEVDVVAYQRAAERIAGAVDIRGLSACDPAATGAQACADTFIKTFGRRAFRRPLSDAELTDYQRLYADLRSGLALDHEGGLRGIVEAMLQDVPFLYRWELGPVAPSAAGGVVALSPHELAARLSFFFWQSMPDAALFAAADAGSLRDAGVRESEARRLLSDPKAADMLRGFFLQWLEISIRGAAKSPDLYPDFNAALAQNMEDEVLRFAHGIVTDPTAGLRDLFTSQRGFADAALGRVYGVNVTSASLEPVTLDGVQRPGILTRSAFLAATANAYEGDPTKRGSVIRRRILCQPLAPPPANIPPLPPPAANATVRERHTEHLANSACSGCHRLTDLIGFGFGHYDAVGRFQTNEAGRTIDASGTIVALDGQDRSFSGPIEMMNLLAGSPDVETCMTKQWLRFLFDRLETPADEHSLHQIATRFAATNHNFTELLIAITKSRSFLYRAAAPGEVTQ